MKGIRTHIAAKPIVLAIAGLDPCAGAGLLADIKAIESHGAYAMGVVSCLTNQNEFTFKSIQNRDINAILAELETLSELYCPCAIKIGLMPNVDHFQALLIKLKELFPEVKIVWDPILQSSSGFSFNQDIYLELEDILKYIYLITPNAREMSFLFPQYFLNSEGFKPFTNVLLKAGHLNTITADDVLLKSDGDLDYIKGTRIEGVDKHGTGCVLSASIAANLALGKSLIESCTIAKQYMNEFLLSGDGLLGNHR